MELFLYSNVFKHLLIYILHKDVLTVFTSVTDFFLITESIESEGHISPLFICMLCNGYNTMHEINSECLEHNDDLSTVQVMRKSK